MAIAFALAPSALVALTEAIRIGTAAYSFTFAITFFVAAVIATVCAYACIAAIALASAFATVTWT